MSLYHEKHEFIFKSDFSIENDLNTLLYKAEDYKFHLKSPSEFWENSKERKEQEYKILEVENYINNLKKLIDALN